MLNDDYFEPCFSGSEDDLSADELPDNECDRQVQLINNSIRVINVIIIVLIIGVMTGLILQLIALP